MEWKPRDMEATGRAPRPACPPSCLRSELSARPRVAPTAPLGSVQRGPCPRLSKTLEHRSGLGPLEPLGERGSQHKPGGATVAKCGLAVARAQGRRVAAVGGACVFERKTGARQEA